MGYGDEILAAGQAQRVYLHTGRRSLIVDKQGKPRWHPIWDRNPVLVHPTEPGDPLANHLQIINGPDCRPYIVYPFTAESGWTFNRAFRARDNIARIYLTGDELKRGYHLRERYGKYVLFDLWSKHENLRWPVAHWQALIASLPAIQFVQQTYTGVPRLTAPNVHHEPTPSFRDACGVLNSAICYVRGESGMLHAAAALGKKSVAIWGACMDWEVLGGYPKQRGVGIAPQDAICGSYKPCRHCAETMAAIPVDDVKDALLAQLRVE